MMSCLPSTLFAGWIEYNRSRREFLLRLKTTFDTTKTPKQDKAARLTGCTREQIKRVKALKVLGLTEAELQTAIDTMLCRLDEAEAQMKSVSNQTGAIANAPLINQV